MQDCSFLTNLKKKNSVIVPTPTTWFPYQSHFPYEEKYGWSSDDCILSTMVLVTMCQLATSIFRHQKTSRVMNHMILGLQDPECWKRRCQKNSWASMLVKKDWLSQESLHTVTLVCKIRVQIDNFEKGQIVFNENYFYGLWPKTWRIWQDKLALSGKSWIVCSKQATSRSKLTLNGQTYDPKERNQKILFLNMSQINYNILTSDYNYLDCSWLEN